MKFTPSSSVSSSSTTSFNGNFCRGKGNAFGCFTGVLSRILCSKNPPTRPIDPIECNKTRHFSNIEKVVVDGSATPNVVARLMGLDSMPEFSSNSNQMFLCSIARSKSMDSEDFSVETGEMQGQHRRVKTSVSFRETPGFFDLEDEDFFVLNFDNRGKNKKKGSNFGNSEGRKHRRRDQCGRRNRDEQSMNRVYSNEERLTLKLSPQNPPKVDVQKQDYLLSPREDKFSCRKEEFDVITARKDKFLGECKDEAESDSENSSPVSVLDHITEFISDPEITTSEEDAGLGGSESVCQDCCTSQSNERCKREKDGNVGLKRRDYIKQEHREMLRRICSLAEADVNNAHWTYELYRGMLTADELQDTALYFGQGIFDQLVSELIIDQLVGLECHRI